jgi:hypothetical protein
MRRQKIRDTAGDSYVAAEDVLERFPRLKSFKNEQFLFGVQRDGETWTVLSVRYIFASYGGELYSLRVNEWTEKIFDNVGRAQTKMVSEIVLDDGKRIWMPSVGMCSAFQNMLLMLQKLPEDIVLDK